MTSIHRSLIIALVERYALVALSLLSSIIVARLLTPTEIGIYAIATAFIGVAQAVRDVGVGSFLIREPKLSEIHVRSALGVSLLLGCAFFAAYLFISHFAAYVFGEVRVKYVLQIVALNFVVLPFCSISIALLRREMQFGRLLIVNVTAATVGMCVIVSLALLGYGPASMAWGSVAANVTTGLVAWGFRTDRRFIWPSLSQWRPIVRFGTQTTLAAVMWSAAVDLNDLIVGKVLGFSPLALLSRAQGLMNLFNRDIMSAVRGVLYPAFARAFREREPVNALYIAGVANVTVFAWPFYGMAALYPLEIIRLLFGPQWDSAAPLVPVFCVAGAVASIFNLIAPWMTAMGRVELLTVAELIVQPMRVVAIAIAALHYQTIFACAVASLIVTILAVPVFYGAKSRCGETQYRQLLRVMWQSGKVTLLSLSVPAAVAVYVGLGRSHPVSILVPILTFAIGAAVWVASTTWFAHPITTTPIYRNAFGRFVASK